MIFDNIEESNDALIAETRDRYENAKTPAEREAVILDAIRADNSFQRNFAIEKRAGTSDETSEDARTIEFSFSSDEPVLRWWGEEILDHDAGSVRLDRMNAGAPLLLDHSPTAEKHIGVIEKASIESGKGRAVARLGRNDKSLDALRDIEDGILRNVSVGYLVHSIRLEEEREGAPHFIASPTGNP